MRCTGILPESVLCRRLQIPQAPQAPCDFPHNISRPVARGLGLQALEQPRHRARPRGLHLAETICLGLVLPQPLPCKQQVGAGPVGIGATPGRPCGLHRQWPLAESARLARRPPNLESPPFPGMPPRWLSGNGGGVGISKDSSPSKAPPDPRVGPQTSWVPPREGTLTATPPVTTRTLKAPLGHDDGGHPLYPPPPRSHQCPRPRRWDPHPARLPLDLTPPTPPAAVPGAGGGSRAPQTIPALGLRSSQAAV